MVIAVLDIILTIAIDFECPARMCAVPPNTHCKTNNLVHKLRCVQLMVKTVEVL